MKKMLVLTAIVLLACTPVRGVQLSNTELAASAAAAMAAWEGQVMTVTGLIPASQMGITLPHEHLLTTHAGADLDLTDESLATSELQWYGLAGGKTLVEMTNNGINRQPAAMKRISEATGVNVVMGSGYYKNNWQTSVVRAMSVDQIAESIVRDIVDGVDGVHSGVIGEIGVSRSSPTFFERKQLEAVAIAQKATGAAVNLHFDYEDTYGQRDISLNLLETSGADLSRVVVSHVSPKLSEINRAVQMLQRGIYLEFDYFGQEKCPDIVSLFAGFSDPGQEVKALIDRGYLNQILISQDVCFPQLYKVNGGYGYDHILNNILPNFRAAGITDAQIHTIMVENPQRLFQFKNYAAPEPSSLVLLGTASLGLVFCAIRKRRWR